MSPQIKLAREAFGQLAFLNNESWTSHREKLFALCKAEEKEHRGFMSGFTEAHTTDTASVADCARLFAVKRIAEYLTGDEMPKGKDYLHIQASCFYAAGLADEFGDKIIREAWKGFDLQQLRELDYTTIVKVKEAA